MFSLDPDLAFEDEYPKSSIYRAAPDRGAERADRRLDRNIAAGRALDLAAVSLLSPAARKIR
jgi:hypothetical protein